MGSGCLGKVIVSDVKHNFLVHYGIAVGLLFLTGILFGLAELDARLAAQPLEKMMPLLGMILFVPIFLPEQNREIEDVVRSKRTSHTLVCMLRLACSALIILGLTGILSLYMKYNACEVTLAHFASAAAGAMSLGGIGFFVAAVSDNAVAGYMSTIIYYLMNYTMRNWLGPFYLFSMSAGMECRAVWQLALAGTCIVAGILLRRYKKQ
ncbi:MAG: hypothetical protein J5898_08975 [Lachnospiraceae bacterium]|nr:hypothetical protein [Lachnospiraceae bacterium]